MLFWINRRGGENHLLQTFYLIIWNSNHAFNLFLPSSKSHCSCLCLNKIILVFVFCAQVSFGLPLDRVLGIHLCSDSQRESSSTIQSLKEAHLEPGARLLSSPKIRLVELDDTQYFSVSQICQQSGRVSWNKIPHLSGMGSSGLDCQTSNIWAAT